MDSDYITYANAGFLPAVEMTKDRFHTLALTRNAFTKSLFLVMDSGLRDCVVMSFFYVKKSQAFT